MEQTQKRELTPEQKAYKLAKDEFRATIKEMESNQRRVKAQRKTVNFTGTRTLTPDMANTTHRLNRYDLRHYYLAYGIMRSMYGGYTKLNKITKGTRIAYFTDGAGEAAITMPHISEDYINKILKLYAPKVVRFNP